MKNVISFTFTEQINSWVTSSWHIPDVIFFHCCMLSIKGSCCKIRFVFQPKGPRPPPPQVYWYWSTNFEIVIWPFDGPKWLIYDQNNSQMTFNSLLNDNYWLIDLPSNQKLLTNIDIFPMSITFYLSNWQIILWLYEQDFDFEMVDFTQVKFTYTGFNSLIWCSLSKTYWLFNIDSFIF